MARPELVLFDLDGVLAHYRHEDRLRMLAQRCGASMDAVYAALFGSGLERDADLGLHGTDAVVAELARALGTAVSLDDCIDARAAAMRADDKVLALATALSARTRVAILTNNGLMLRDHLPRICPPLFPLFEGGVFCSAQFGCGKPDPRIFADCLRELGVAADRALFIDDKRANVEGAIAAGLAAHHFLHAAGLRAELETLDLLEPADATH